MFESLIEGANEAVVRLQFRARAPNCRRTTASFAPSIKDSNISAFHQYRRSVQYAFGPPTRFLTEKICAILTRHPFLGFAPARPCLMRILRIHILLRHPHTGTRRMATLWGQTKIGQANPIRLHFLSDPADDSVEFRRSGGFDLFVQRFSLNNEFSI